MELYIIIYLCLYGCGTFLIWMWPISYMESGTFHIWTYIIYIRLYIYFIYWTACIHIWNMHFKHKNKHIKHVWSCMIYMLFIHNMYMNHVCHIHYSYRFIHIIYINHIHIIYINHVCYIHYSYMFIHNIYINHVCYIYIYITIMTYMCLYIICIQIYIIIYKYI